MRKPAKPHYVFDPTYDTKDMAVVRERMLKWSPPYPDPQTPLDDTLSRIAITAEQEIKILRKK